MTYKEFIQNNPKLSFKFTKMPYRIDRNAKQWDAKASHYATTLTFDDHKNPVCTMRIVYSQGSGITHPPHFDDVLQSIVCDVQGVGETTFSDWCDEYGYSDDSINAHEVYKACLDERLQLKNLFKYSLSLYQDLLECEEE